jgi:U2 small nuclear ribonucleoprotein B''
MSFPFPFPFPAPFTATHPPGPSSLSGVQQTQILTKEEEVLLPDETDPNETLYVNNLNDRIKEGTMKPYLKKLFAQFGPCDVIVMSSLRRRGQAWIIYENMDQSRLAMEALQSQTVFGKKMRISYSRNMSDLTRERKKLPPRHRDLRIRTSDEFGNAKRTKSDRSAEDFFETSIVAPKSSSTSQYNPPNKTLVVENLTESVSHSFIEELFCRFQGFVEVRLIPGRGLAFVEFTDEHRSQVALSKLNNFEVEKGNFLIISNAKK